MRLLQQWDDHDRSGTPRTQPEAERIRGEAGARGTSMPMRRAQPHRAGSIARLQGSAAVTAALRNVSRRSVLKAGAGLVVGIAFAPLLAPAQGSETPVHLPGSVNGNRLLSAWLRVNPNGTVTVFTGKVEFGQGIASALAQIAADELDVGYRRINMVTADTSLTPDEGFTAGSQSIEQSGTAIRFACAEARQMLLAAAAGKLGVQAGDLTVADGAITAPGGKRTTYWAVTTDALLRREATG